MARNKHPEETISLILDVSMKLFLEKGYDHTSIQDIINGLGGLSKGAIYHHFKSKEDILSVIADKIGHKTEADLVKVRDREGISGLEKLRAIYKASMDDPQQDLLMVAAPDILKNPRFLAMQIQETFAYVAPKFIRPIIEQGIADGSLQAENPGELAEAVILLSNIWMNPLVASTTRESMLRKCTTFNALMRGALGVDLLDDEMIAQYMRRFQHWQANVENDKKLL